MVTYYSEFKDNYSIQNPILGSMSFMRSSGSFNSYESCITKKIHNKARIFCEDASTLFGITRGSLRVTMSLPYNMNKGIIDASRFSGNNYMLWGVNMGLNDIEKNGIGAFFTNEGIEFKIKSSAGSYSIIDYISNIEENVFFNLDFIWDKNGINGNSSNPNLVIRVNNKNIIGGFLPIIDEDSDINLPFFNGINQTLGEGVSFQNKRLDILDNVFCNNNLECSIKSIIISNTSDYFEEIS